MSHNLAGFAFNLPSATQMAFRSEKKIITTNSMRQNGVTAVFIWKQCQRVHNIVENAAQNIQRMYSGCSVGELFLACYRYF